MKNHKEMFKIICYPLAVIPLSLLLCQSISTSVTTLAEANTSHTVQLAPNNKEEKKDTYTLWNLSAAGLSKEAFNYAMKGYNYLEQQHAILKRNILTIVDFSKPSVEKRLFVIDMNEGKLLFNTLVAHGRNSGYEYATKFSNIAESNQSSLGFYVTLDTYNGGNGYSLRLKGCEQGFNDKAYNRSIVVHGADYVSESFIHDRGFLGRSYGCPAVPKEFSKEIIDVIKNGSCLFLYNPEKKYLSRSKILNT